jgi:hypothetical protein
VTGYEILAIAIAVVAALIALLSARWSSNDRQAANKLVAEANVKLGTANDIAREAKELDSSAVATMSEANALSTQANRLIAEANELSTTTAAIDQKRFENEELDRLKAAATRQFTKFRVTWSDDFIRIQNIGAASATDVSWTVRSSTGKEFGVHGEPTSASRIDKGDTWKFRCPAVMGMDDIFFAMSWQDPGRSIRTDLPELQLPRGNPITFSI